METDGYWLSKQDVVAYLTTKPDDIVVTEDKIILFTILVDNDGALLMPVSKFNSGIGSRWHAEHQALYQVKDFLRSSSTSLSARVIFIMNFSPCEKCSQEIIDFCDNFESIEFQIIFSGVKQDNMAALERMMFHGFRRIELTNIRGLMWCRLLMWHKNQWEPWWSFPPQQINTTQEQLTQIVQQQNSTSNTSQSHRKLLKEILTLRGLQETMVEEVMGDKLFFPIPINGDRFLDMRLKADNKTYDIVTGKHFLHSV